MRKTDQLSWLPTLLCLLVAVYTVGVTPTPYVIIPAAAALALSIWGTIAASFRIFGWSSACTLASCVLNLMEKRPVAWFEPVLMGLAIMCFLGIAHITSICAGKDTSPELMKGYEGTADANEEGNDEQTERAALDRAPTVRAVMSIAALRVAAIALASLSFSYVFLALAGARAKRLEEAIFMILLGATIIGVSTYWLVRLAAPDAYKKPHQ
ncbi:MAG: hypothetical protein PHH46_06940 [Firmicutes bacterium]|nr:hypothetical protein [Bacillota bacterium]